MTTLGKESDQAGEVKGEATLSKSIANRRKHSRIIRNTPAFPPMEEEKDSTSLIVPKTKAALTRQSAVRNSVMKFEALRIHKMKTGEMMFSG